MENEFINYTQAVALKELGFDESCFGYYIETKEWIPASYSQKGTIYPSNSDLMKEWVSAPLYQQAFKFFREKHNLLHELNSVQKDSWLITIWETSSTTKHGVYNGKRWDCDDLDENIPHTYEEAESSCLDKLIEICKNK